MAAFEKAGKVKLVGKTEFLRNLLNGQERIQ